MTVKIEVLGIPELRRFMDKKQQRVQQKIPKGLRKATLYLHGKVKESIARGTNAPVAVDTGRFLNSIDFDSGKDYAIIFSELSYARHVEFGTTKMKKRPHFRNTKAKEQDKVIRIVKTEMKSI